MQIQFDFDLSGFNTMRLPATAAAYVEISAIEQLIHIKKSAEQVGLPIEVIGSGSNLLFKPYINALVVRWSADAHYQLISDEDDARIVLVDAGYDWQKWVVDSISFGHGLENLALIPGTVGASPVQNIGAYGVEVSSFIEFVEAFDFNSGQLIRYAAPECQFSYRESIFKHPANKKLIITRVAFRLSKSFAPNLSYGPLQDLAENKDLTAAELIAKVSHIRSSKLPNPATIANVGSFFKNPIINQQHYQSLNQQYSDIPCFAADMDRVKIPAAWLIEQCGWKGRRQGSVGMHHQQALVMTADQAQLQDVLQLQSDIEQSVFENFAIRLEREPQLLG